MPIYLVFNLFFIYGIIPDDDFYRRVSIFRVLFAIYHVINRLWVIRGKGDSLWNISKLIGGNEINIR